MAPPRVGGNLSHDNRLFPPWKTGTMQRKAMGTPGPDPLPAAGATGRPACAPGGRAVST